MNTEKTDILSLTYEELAGWMQEQGEPAYRTKQVFDWMHRRLAGSFEEMNNLPRTLRGKLEETCEFRRVQTRKRLVSSEDGSRKYLFQLTDDHLIESVLMRYRHGNSVCVSSQVGCAMGCKFCASTIHGMIRNLTVSEMLSQVYEIQKDLSERISHIVIMGMGEPLLNYRNVMGFIRMISDENTLHISQRNITISTCGIVPAILSLCQEHLKCTLAVSLHAPNDTIRSTIMPVARTYRIADILKACDRYFECTGRRVTFEYCMIHGVNDQPQHARELSDLLRSRSGRVHVNLIPVNPVRGNGFDASKEQNILVFTQILEESGIAVTRRRQIGRDISGACGQLVRRTL